MEKAQSAADPAHTPLSRLAILALDCQATGANPEKGRLLEIGWMPGRADGRLGTLAAASLLIRQPLTERIPPAVSRITGICETHLAQAVSEQEAWHRLMAAAAQVAALNGSAPCPLVIHFARFELPFLSRLHALAAPGTPFPFETICTHQIARRLLPELPRRGLRALAGYFGHAVPELKRCAHHVPATLLIWQRLVDLLQSRSGVHSLETLKQWLAATPKPSAIQRRFPMTAELGRLPNQPGIYRMRRAGGDILYVGKAKSLRQRVNSYFRGRARHAEHILEMLTQALDLDFVTTPSALEAAVLEADEIKQHGPPYNMALRGDSRCLAYFTKDLLHMQDHGDKAFCVGPVPFGRSVPLLTAFAHWVGREMRPDGDLLDAFAAAMGGASSTPSRACVQAGLALFLSTYPQTLQHGSALRSLTALGTMLWRLRRLAEPCEFEPEEEDGEDRPEAAASPPADWVPADIAARLESLLLGTAHMLRRARWFRQLSESALAWAAADDPHTLKHLLLFERGHVVQRAQILPGRGLSVPQDHARPFRERGLGMDLATYDRLRVVTTELRRLVCEERAIELRLRPDIRLSSTQLRRLLRWV